MLDAFSRGTTINPMRVREEIKSVEISVARLESLLKQIRSRPEPEEFDRLREEIRDEATFLRNAWQAIEQRTRGTEGIGIPYSFLKRKIKPMLHQEMFENDRKKDIEKSCENE